MRQFLTLLLCLLVSTVMAAPAAPSSQQNSAALPRVAVIVKGDGPLVALSQDQVKAIYLGKLQFSGGTHVNVLLCGETGVEESFLAKVLGMSKVRFKELWSHLGFENGIKAPSLLADSAAVIKAVKADPGALGFVSGLALLEKASDGTLLFTGTKVLFLTELDPGSKS